MERLTIETIENIISAEKFTVDAFENEEDYCSALDKCIIRGMEELKQYRIAEEQGLLLRLPIPIKSEVYCITNTLKVQLGIVQPEIKRMYVKRYEYNHLNNFTIVLGDPHIPFGIREGEVRIFKQELGKTVFLTKEEAEEALAKMKEGVINEV